jgi:hypothetical protein
MIEQKSPKEFLKILQHDQDIIKKAVPKDVLNDLYGESAVRSWQLSFDEEQYDADARLQCILTDITAVIAEPARSHIRNNVAIGETLLREVNASIRKCASGYRGYVITINAGLDTLFYTFTKLLMTIAESKHPIGKFDFKPLMNKDGLTTRLQQLIDLYHQNAVATLPVGDILVKDERVGMIAFLYSYCRSFVILHELGHYLHKHLEKDHSVNQEYEADKSAFSMLLNYVYRERDDWVIYKAIAGAFIALQYLAFLEKRYPNINAIHPTADRRVESLRKSFSFPDKYYELADGLVELCNLLLKDLH